MRNRILDSLNGIVDDRVTISEQIADLQKKLEDLEASDGSESEVWDIKAQIEKLEKQLAEEPVTDGIFGKKSKLTVDLVKKAVGKLPGFKSVIKLGDDLVAIKVDQKEAGDDMGDGIIQLNLSKGAPTAKLFKNSTLAAKYFEEIEAMRKKPVKDAVSAGACKSCGYKADNPEYKFCPSCGKGLKGAMTFEASEVDDDTFKVVINGKEYEFAATEIHDPNYNGKLKGVNNSTEIVAHINALAEKAGPGKATQFLKKYFKLVKGGKTRDESYE